jgi:hypothetical protein
LNQTVRTLGIAIDLAGVFLLFIGIAIQGYQKKRPINWGLADKIVRTCWVVGGGCIIGGLVTIGMSF